MNKLISQVMPNMNKNNNSRGVSGVNMPGGLPGMSAARPTQRPMSMEEMLKNIDKAVEKLEKEQQRKQDDLMNKSAVGKINPVKVPANMANNSSIDPLKNNHSDNVSNGVNNMVIQSKPLVNKQSEKKNTINSTDFAARITNRVNQAVKGNHEGKDVNVKSNSRVETNNEVKKSDYVTDDQFFDDFFADDDD